MALIDPRVAKIAKVVLQEDVERAERVGRDRERVALKDDITRVGKEDPTAGLTLKERLYTPYSRASSWSMGGYKLLSTSYVPTQRIG